MSQAKVEIVLRVYPAPDVNVVTLVREEASWALWRESIAPLFAPDAESVWPGLPGGAKTFTGLDGLRSALLDWTAPWATYRTEVEEAIDCGERVVLLAPSFGRLADGVETTAPAFVAIAFREGQIVPLELFLEREEALMALRQTAQLSTEMCVGAGRADCGGRSSRFLRMDNRGTMPGDRIELLRGVFAEWEKGNFRASAGLLSPDVVSIWGEPPGDDVVCHGRREVAERFGEFLANWSEFRVEAEEFIELDEDHVLVVARQFGRGKASGVVIDARVHIAWKFAGEKVVGTYWFFDRAKVLRVAGLSDAL